MASGRGQDQQQQNFWQNQSQQAVQNMSQVNPLEQMMTEEGVNFLKWDNGQLGAKDITKAPGMSASLDIYNRAKERSKQRRFGVGSIALSDGNSGYADKLREQQNMEMEENAAGDLANAYRLKSAEVRGSVLPLATLDQSRRNAVADVSSGNLHAYLNRPKQKPFWQTLVESVGQGISYGSKGWAV